MKKTKRLFAALLAAALLLALCQTGLAAQGGAGETLYVNTQQLTDSLTYTRAVSRVSSSSRVETYALELSPGGDISPIVMACDTIYGGMTIKNAISYAESQGYNVVAAINADFFSSHSIPTGVVVEDGVYKSSPEWNSVYGFFGDGTAFVESYPTVTISLTVNGESVKLTHFNKTRQDGGGLYLYSSAFSTVSTRTSTDGWMVRLRILEGQPTVSGTMRLEVAELIEGSKAVSIGDGYLILTADTTSELEYIFEKFSVGDEVTLTTTCSSENLINAQWAGGGGDVLISGGAITASSSWNNAAGSNPRTALGVKSDGSTVYLVADGRSSKSSGLTLSQLANELLAMGCVSAVNLDGGGSSVMAVQTPGKSSCGIVSVPSDGSARSCGEYILLVTNQSSDGSAKRLYLNEDGAYVLAGSSLSLSFSAMDAGYEPVSVSGVTAQSEGGLGEVSGGVYTAGQSAGTDTLALSDGAASGEGSVHVVTKADTLSVVNAKSGASVSTISLEPGESITLSASLSLLGRAVAADAGAFSYSVSGGVGSFSGSTFTAAGSPGTKGTVTVSAGGVSKSISVVVCPYFYDAEGHWAESYIYDLVESGIITGTSSTSFSPESSIKRGDFVLMLYRAAGKPSVSGSSGFSDVPEDKYYAAAIAWAAANGIVNGTGNGKFSPEDVLTRQQAFAAVYRALPVLGVSVSSAGDIESTLSAYSDGGEVASWAREAACGLIKLGVVSGSGGYLTPNDSLTRAQTAKLLWASLALK